MTTIARESIETEAINFIEALTRGELPDYPGNLGKYHKDCAFLYSTASKCSGDDTTVRSTKITRLVEDKKKQSATFNSLFTGKPISDAQVTTKNVREPFKAEGKFALPIKAVLHPDLSKGACTWLDNYIDFSRLWSPRGYDGFHEGIGLWLLGTVAARRVVLEVGGDEYTPMFVLLVANTSKNAKTTTAKIGIDVLENAGLKWLLGSNNTTPQKLISDMAGTHVPYNYGDMDTDERTRTENRLAFSGQRGWYYEEFGGGIEAMVKKDGVMSDFKHLLRQLDDCHNEYDTGTIARGTEVIKKPYLSLLGTMTPADLKPYAGRDSKFWSDGLFARFSFITAPSPRPGTARPRFPKGKRIIPSTLTSPLVEWHKRLEMTPLEIERCADKNGKPTQEYRLVRGDLPVNVCTWSPEAEEAFYNYDDALDEISDELDVNWISGNYARFPKKALRIAMLMASLENKGKIELRHWARAQEITERWRVGLHELDMQVNDPTEHAIDETEEKILNLLAKKNQPLTAREVAQGVWGLDTESASRKLTLLVKSGNVETQRIGKKDIYTLPLASVDGVEV